MQERLYAAVKVFVDIAATCQKESLDSIRRSSIDGDDESPSPSDRN